MLRIAHIFAAYPGHGQGGRRRYPIDSSGNHSTKPKSGSAEASLRTCESSSGRGGCERPPNNPLQPSAGGRCGVK